jgi:hypothetical protein
MLLERLTLPMARDGETVDMLLNVTVFHDRGAKGWQDAG